MKNEYFGGNKKIHFDNILELDKEIIEKNIIKNDKNYWKNISDYKIKNFVNNIQKTSNRVKNLNISNKNFTFIYKNFFMSPFEYYYFIKPNSFLGKINLSLFNDKNINQNLNIFKENLTSIGIEYKKQKKNIFIENLTYLKGPWELIFKLKNSNKHFDFKRKENKIKSKIKINFNLINRPFIFREYLLFDPMNKISLEFFKNKQKNIFEDNNINILTNKELIKNNELLKNLPLNDEISGLKLMFLKNSINNKYENYFTKVYFKLINSQNNNFLKFKYFQRLLFEFNNNLLMQFNIDFAYLINFKNEDLKVHEKLYINNFNGILNPSPKTIVNLQNPNNNKDKYYFMLGNNSYLMFNNKILFKNIFNFFTIEKNGFKISPFTHFNTLFINNDFKNLNNIRTSGGFGINIFSKLFSFEILYIPYIKKVTNDIQIKYSVKLGID